MKNDNVLKAFLLVREGARRLASVFGALFIAIILASFLLTAQYFVHEGGHLAGCHLTGLIWHLPVSCSITNIQMIPIYPGVIEIPAPQRTQSDNVHGSPLVYFGGPLLSIIFFILLAFCLKYALKIENKAYWLIACGFILSEIFGNSMCGTDNMTGQPFAICKTQALAFFNQWVLVAFVVLPITYLFYPFVLMAYDKLDSRVQQLFQRKAKKGKTDWIFCEYMKIRGIGTSVKVGEGKNVRVGRKHGYIVIRAGGRIFCLYRVKDWEKAHRTSSLYARQRK